MPEPPQIHVHLLPSLVPPGALRGGVAVVMDVLRATTVMVHALAAGCEAIIPCLEIDEARRAAACLPAGMALLGGERQGLPIEGFDLGNSPGSYTPEVCRGKTLVMTTTNGTRAILACLEAERVLIGAFTNVFALADGLLGEHPIHVVCAGTDGFVSLEDTLCAGALAANLIAQDWTAGNDEAILAQDVWQGVCRQVNQGEPFPELLARGRGGRRVHALGLDADIQAAAQIDPAGVRSERNRIIPELRRDPLRIIAAG